MNNPDQPKESEPKPRQKLVFDESHMVKIDTEMPTWPLMAAAIAMMLMILIGV